MWILLSPECLSNSVHHCILNFTIRDPSHGFKWQDAFNSNNSPVSLVFLFPFYREKTKGMCTWGCHPDGFWGYWARPGCYLLRPGSESPLGLMGGCGDLLRPRTLSNSQASDSHFCWCWQANYYWVIGSDSWSSSSSQGGDGVARWYSGLPSYGNGKTEAEP